ncbi:GNAT family N-acetyltransferase [Candidatus Daviesbacteria bacterium]|nr:GNAT family N-acetyltransferase [Candidatus Daviesbacteria bacterium]
MAKLKVRRYKKEDNPMVWQLHRLGLAEIGIKPTKNSPWEKDLYDIENVYLKDGDFLVGEYEGKVVAMGAFKKNSDEISETKRMRVHPDYQRHGFGTAIIQELEKRAKKLGFKKMILNTSEKWIKAQSFYTKNGYQETGREVFDKKYHAIFYEKELE